MRLEKYQIDQIKEQNPLSEIIGRRVKLKRARKPGMFEGECLCNPVRGKAPLWVSDKGAFGCLKGGCGGDTFKYLEQFEGLDFKAALASLGGIDVQADPEKIRQWQEERVKRAETERAAQARLDEQERAKAFEIWKSAEPAGSVIDDYMRLRGLEPVASKALKFLADEPYYCTDGDKPYVAHRGPCMVWAIQGPDGKFLGIHRTWLDLTLPNGKAKILNKAGEPQASKKMRGLKKGGALRLCEPAGADILICGEGIETSLTVFQSLWAFGQHKSQYAVWAAGDLGNMAGGSRGESRPHPEKHGRFVPSAEPDMDDAGMVPPSWAKTIILLGDGDSDPFITRALVTRGARRFERMGHIALMRFAPDGQDFNDMIRAKVAA